MKRLLLFINASVCLLSFLSEAGQLGSNADVQNLKSSAGVLTPNALQQYQPVDTSRNLLKNGGFEKEPQSQVWIHDFGKPNAHHFCDSQVKHCGRYSLKIGNVPGSYDFATYRIGKIANLKHDFLIRGWYRYENLKDGKGNRLPFFGLWTPAPETATTRLPESADEISSRRTELDQL